MTVLCGTIFLFLFTVVLVFTLLPCLLLWLPIIAPRRQIKLFELNWIELNLEGTWSRVTTPPHRMESVEVVQVSGWDGCLPFEIFCAHPTGRRSQSRPRTRWRDYISLLAWEHLGIPQEELESVAGERYVWIYLLNLLPQWEWILHTYITIMYYLHWLPAYYPLALFSYSSMETKIIWRLLDIKSCKRQMPAVYLFITT